MCRAAVRKQLQRVAASKECDKRLRLRGRGWDSARERALCCHSRGNCLADELGSSLTSRQRQRVPSEQQQRKSIAADEEGPSWLQQLMEQRLDKGRLGCRLGGVAQNAPRGGGGCDRAASAAEEARRGDRHLKRPLQQWRPEDGLGRRRTGRPDRRPGSDFKQPLDMSHCKRMHELRKELQQERRCALPCQSRCGSGGLAKHGRAGLVVV